MFASSSSEKKNCRQAMIRKGTPLQVVLRKDVTVGSSTSDQGTVSASKRALSAIRHPTREHYRQFFVWKGEQSQQFRVPKKALSGIRRLQSTLSIVRCPKRKGAFGRLSPKEGDIANCFAREMQCQLPEIKCSAAAIQSDVFKLDTTIPIDPVFLIISSVSSNGQCQLAIRNGQAHLRNVLSNPDSQLCSARL